MEEKPEKTENAENAENSEKAKVEPISSHAATVNLYFMIRLLGMDNINKTLFYKVYAYQLLFSSCVLQLIAFTTSYVIASSDMSMDTFLTSLQVAINVYAVDIKIAVFVFSMKRLRKTAPILDHLDVKIQTKEERKVAENMITFCQRLVVIYTFFYMSYSTSTWIAALINGHPPFAIYLPFCNWQESQLKMVLASVIEYYLISLSCLQNVGLDAYAVIFVYISRMHMKILSLRVEDLGRDKTKSNEDNEKLLIDCIDTHRKILELIETVRPIIANTVFIQLVVTAVICAVAFVNIMMFANRTSAIGGCFFLLAVCIQTLPMCYTMNVLMDEVNQLPTSIIYSNWFAQNKSFRRMMVFFMQNAQKFEPIMAGNILPIQVSTFLSIGKLAFSIYSLVDKMDERRTAHAAQQ